MNELISVIIPVYNVKAYLDRCILSVINQTYKNLEIIIVDDGSTDGSGELCDEYQQRDKRIKVLHKKNEGLSSARNCGLDIAKGSYIGFVDSDDYIMEDMYESLVACMEKGIDFACCGTIYVHEEQKNRRSVGYVKASGKTTFTNVEAIEELLLHRYISFSAWDKLYRKELFDGLRFPFGRTSEDLPVVYEIIKKSKKVVNIGKAKYFYCCREDSISRRDFYYRRIDYVLFAAEICKDVHKSYPQFALQADALYIQYVAYMIEHIRACKNRVPYQNIERRLVKVIYHMFIRILHNKFISNEKKKKYLMTMLDYEKWKMNKEHGVSRKK